MRISLKLCIFSVVFVLLAGILVSQACADDDAIIRSDGKKNAVIDDRPTIDCGEPGDTPTKDGAMRSAGVGAIQGVQATQVSGASLPGDNINWRVALQRFSLFLLRQLYW